MNYPLRWLVLVIMVMLAACSDNDEHTLEVEGKLKHVEQIGSSYPGAVSKGRIKLALYEIPYGEEQPILLDTTSIHVSQESFRLKGATTGSGKLYNLSIENGPLLPLINDSKSITVDVDFSNKSRFYNVKGSAASEQLKDFIFTYSDERSIVEQQMQALDSLKYFKASDSAILAATNKKNQALDRLNGYLKNFLLHTKQGTLASFALGRAAQTLPVSDFEATLSQLTQRFPQDSNLLDIKNKYETYKTQQAARSGSWIGKKAPELVLPDTKGRNIALSSFKGKYVLVDFWASWCNPCRAENPNVVNAYQQFKDKNFTILGVSLDRTKAKWLEAIKEDQLTWTHVSDLAYWDSKAVSTFGFNGIPFNVLLDPEGTVIAQDLRGAALEAKLQEVLP